MIMRAPAPTDLREAIKAAYKELRALGYFCRSAFWCCGTCGVAAVPKRHEDKFVFYHRQDAARISEDGSCYLAWAGDGEEIAGAMRRAGLKVEWNGSGETRILVRLT